VNKPEIEDLPVSDEVKSVLIGYTLTEYKTLGAVVAGAPPVQVVMAPPMISGTAQRLLESGELIVKFRAKVVTPKSHQEILDSWPHGYRVSKHPGVVPEFPYRWTVDVYSGMGSVRWSSTEHTTRENAIREAAKWCKGATP
jgi:hypothetical protein